MTFNSVFFNRHSLRRMVLCGSAALILATLTLVPSPAAADQVVPLVAHIHGKFGSLFTTDAKFFNPYSYPIVLTLRVTNVGESFSQAASGASYTIGPGETLGIANLYQALEGNVFGKGRLDIEVKDVSGLDTNNPITRISIANIGGDLGGEYQQYMLAVEPDDFHAGGTSLADTTIKGTTERYNFSVTTGNESTQIHYIYRNSAGGNARAWVEEYPANTTVQHVDPQLQFGLSEFEPNSSMVAFIVSGSAVIFGTPGDKTTSAFRVEEWTAFIESHAHTVAIQYVLKWIPPAYDDFFLSYLELRNLVLGGGGLQSLAPDLAEILHEEHPGVFDSAAAAESWLRERVNLETETDAEFSIQTDPFEWRPFPAEIVFHHETGDPASFRISTEASEEIYYLVRGLNDQGVENDGFLIPFVRRNPELYGGPEGGVPDLNLDPTWDTQNTVVD